MYLSSKISRCPSPRADSRFSHRQGNLAVAIAVGISLFAIAILASVSGAGLLFLLGSLGLDPALMSAPCITSAVDVLGVFIYLTVARFILDL